MEMTPLSKLRANPNSLNIRVLIHVIGLSDSVRCVRLVVAYEYVAAVNHAKNEPDRVFTFTLKYRLKPEVNLCAELSVL